MVVKLAAEVTDLIKTRAMLSFDSGPIFIRRTNRSFVSACSVNLLAILREVAVHDVAITKCPAHDELFSLIEIITPKEAVLVAIAFVSVIV